MTWLVRTNEENSVTMAYYPGHPEFPRPQEEGEVNVFVLGLAWCWCSLKGKYQTGELKIPQVGDLMYWSSSDHGKFHDEKRDFIAESMKSLYPSVYKSNYCPKVSSDCSIFMLC
jgi:hypothetical protein